MAVAATSPAGKKMETLRTMLSESSNFQTGTGAANAAAALSFVHLVSAVPPYTRPFAVINPPRLTYMVKSGGLDLGQMNFGIEDKAGLNLDDADSAMTFMNFADFVIQDLVKFMGEGQSFDTLAGSSIEQVTEFIRSREEDREDLWAVFYTVNFGVRG